nr:homeobox protein 2 isoform X2 [Helicoverpa armigera]
MDLALFILILQIGFNSALNYRHSNRMAVIPSSRLFNIELSRRSAPYNRNLQRTSRSYSGSDSEETDFDYTSYEEPVSFTSFKLYKRRKNPTQVTKAHNEAKFEQLPSKLHSDNHAGPLDKKGTDFRRPYILHGTQNRRLGPTSIHDIKDLEDVVHRRAANYLKLLFTIIEEQNSRRNLNDDRKVPINSPATSSANFLGSRFVETANRRRSNHEVGNRYRTDSRNNQPLPLKRAGSFDAAPPMPVSRSQLRIPDPLKPSKHETARRRDDDYNNDVDYNNEENDGNEDEDGNNDDNDNHDHRHIGDEYNNANKVYDYHHVEDDHNNDDKEYDHHHVEDEYNNANKVYDYHHVEDEYNNDDKEYDHHHVEDDHNNDENEYNHHHVEDEYNNANKVYDYHHVEDDHNNDDKEYDHHHVEDDHNNDEEDGDNHDAQDDDNNDENDDFNHDVEDNDNNDEKGGDYYNVEDDDNNDEKDDDNHDAQDDDNHVAGDHDYHDVQDDDNKDKEKDDNDDEINHHNDEEYDDEHDAKDNNNLDTEGDDYDFEFESDDSCELSSEDEVTPDDNVIRHYFKAYIKPFIDFALATYDDSKNKAIASPTAKALLDKLKVLPHFDQEDKNDTKEVKSLRLSDLVDIKSRSISHNGKLGKSKEDKKNTGGLLVSPIHRSSDLTEKLGDLKVIPINLTIEIKFNNEVREEQHESHKKRLDPHTILTNFEQTLLKNDTSETLGQQKPHNKLRSGECPEQSRTKHNNTDDESSATDSSSNNTEDDSDSDKSHEDENDRDQENSIDIPVNKDDDNKTDIFPETEPLKTAEDANETNSILNLEFPLNDILSSSDDNNTSSEVDMEDFLRNHDSRYKPEYSDLLARSPSDNNNNTSSEVDMEDFLRGHDSKQKPEYSDLMTLGPSDNNNNTSSEVDMELTPDDDVIRHYFEALIKPLIDLVLATYDDANNKDIASPTVKALLDKLKVLTNIDEEDKDDTNEVKSLRLSDLVDIKSPLISHDGKLSKSKEDKKNTIRLLISPIHRSSDLTETLGDLKVIPINLKVEIPFNNKVREEQHESHNKRLDSQTLLTSMLTNFDVNERNSILNLEFPWNDILSPSDDNNNTLSEVDMEDFLRNHDSKHKPEYLNLEYPWARVFTDETAIRKDEDQTLDLEYLWKNVINTEDNKNSKQITNSLQLGVPQLEDTVYNQLRNHKKHTGKVDTNKLKQQPAKSKASPDEGISTEKISSHSSDPLYEHPLLRQHKQNDQRAFHDTRDNYLRQFGTKLNLRHYSNNNDYNPAQNYLRDVPNEPDVSDEDGEGRAFIMVPLDRRPLTRLRTQEDLPYILNVLGPQLRRSTYNDTIIFPSD